MINKVSQNDNQSILTQLMHKFLNLISNPLRRTIVLTFLWMITLFPESGLTSKNIAPGLIATLAVLINMVFLIIRIIFIGVKEKINRGKKVFKFTLITIMPILAIISIPLIEYTASYVFVMTRGNVFIQQIPANPTPSFKYGRFKLYELIGHSGPWVIYDESEQLILPTQSRSPEWWQVSNESDDAEYADCWSPARKLYEHFFIRYFSC